MLKADKRIYLEFIATDEIKRSLINLPKASHLCYLRNLFQNKTGIEFTEATQHRIRKAMKANENIIPNK
jgi:hypothetical protein